MLKIAGFAVVAAVVYIVVKQNKPEYAVLVQLGSICAVLMILLPDIKAVIDFVQGFFDSLAVGSEFFTVLIKALGIGLAAQFAADTCRDAGENALASAVELAGKAMIIVLALPLVRAVAELSIGMING